MDTPVTTLEHDIALPLALALALPLRVRCT